MSLGISWGLLGGQGTILGSSWVLLGASWGPPALFWPDLGGLWEVSRNHVGLSRFLGIVFGGLGSLLGAMLTLCRTTWNSTTGFAELRQLMFAFFFFFLSSWRASIPLGARRVSRSAGLNNNDNNGHNNNGSKYKNTTNNNNIIIIMVSKRL